mmetsp:Transcript_33931/g.59149  ORF Transcript_33931/g.59149 Transcript_33931/m.59149 type:complete len:359 (-) Transcript_33931:31-1107(-)|eukprot:CAMPEP_0204918580 /NCGR_PEP_ID=MMETSP1397-20131031/16243_1 /ASSEMBLY_ACC=CAM_ASM_000891 /TAXON_ID=49980 /ORGANISM="Climacostomum Climacostomum virens, Strain Stock W-24" /LENGTH=358 /DNA_ID=CAMNT_0052091909 /DNA_START=67 /DNA_END=1143 /DNA_ORIENTATION=+
MKSAFLVCILVSAAFATSADLLSLKRTDYGKKLLASIELQLAMEGPVDKVLALLQDLDDGLVQEQADHDDKHANFQAECESTLANYAYEIDTAESDKSQAEAELSFLIPAIFTAEQQLAEAKANKQATIDRKERAIDIRNKEHEDYLVRVQEHQDAISACDLATEQVLTLKSSSFLQKPTMLQLNSHLKAVKRVAPAYGGLFKLLIQIAADPQANQETVTKLINLISKLRSSFVSSLELEHSNEADAQQAHDELVESLDETISELTVYIAQTSHKLETYYAEKADSEYRKADAEGRIETFTTLYDQKKAQCEDEAAEYKKETARRQCERETIEEASTLISARLSNLSEHVSSRVEHIE